MFSRFLLLLFVLSSLKSCFGGAPNSHVPIFVLGDSLYDPGNNNYLNSTTIKANFPPYGETFFRKPTGRFCDGRQVTDFIATDAGLPLWYPYLSNMSSHRFITNGANFASSGAGVFDETNPGTLSLTTQVDYLEEVASLLENKFGATTAKSLLNKAIYQMSIGGNDYIDFYQNVGLNSTEQEQQQFVNQVIGNLTEAVKRIYDLGARKFAFQSVGPMGCSPSMRQTNFSNCVEMLQSMSRMHNAAFSKVIKELEKELSGFKYSNFDYYTSLLSIIENPTQYGFETANACCGTGPNRGDLDCGEGEYELCENPSKHVFWDGAHPTETTNILIAKLFWNGSSNVTEPLNFKRLYELDIEGEDFLGETQKSNLADE